MNWPTAKLKYVAQLGYGDSLSSSESAGGQFRVFGSNGPYGWSSTANTKPPSIIIGRKGSYGKVNWASEACFASDTTFFIDSTTCNHNLRWLYWLLQTLDLDKWTDEAAVPGLNREVVYSKIVAIPPRAWQRAIAVYLDRETARLDALVAAKERLLKLLAEKRRAVVTRAVTRGLDPRAPMRDSGVPWLGEIPAHWNVRRLKHVGQAIIGLTFGPRDIANDGKGVLVLRAANVLGQKAVITEDSTFVRMNIPENLRTRAGDILICSRSGSRNLIGKSALLDESFAGCTFGVFMTVFRSVRAFEAYVFFVLNSPMFDFQAGSFSTSTINQLTIETLGNMKVPLPPRSEQRKISSYLRDEDSRFDSLMDKARRTISLLKERRAALIAAAVTGRIAMPDGNKG